MSASIEPSLPGGRDIRYIHGAIAPGAAMHILLVLSCAFSIWMLIDAHGYVIGMMSRGRGEIQRLSPVEYPRKLLEKRAAGS